MVDGVDMSPVRLSVTDDQWLNGIVDLIATTNTVDRVAELSVDGTAVDTNAALESAPVFAMEVTATDMFFRNGILLAMKF